MTLFRFENPSCLFFFFALPLYWGALMYWSRRAQVSIRKAFLVTFALSFMVLGMARPQMGHSVTEAHSLKSQVFFAIDVSRSMLALDTPPSRLGFAQAFLFRLIPQLNSARFALYPFTQNGYLQLPLTNDETAAMDMIASLNPNLVSNQGTDLNQGVETLFKHLSRLEEKAKTTSVEWLPTQVLLISDGESHTPINSEFLRLYRSKRIPIHTVIVGTEGGANIPADKRGFDYNPNLRDSSGRTVITKANPENMRMIAKETGGTYFVGQFDVIPELLKTLRQTATLGRLSTNFKVEAELFPYLFLMAFVLLLVDLFSRRWSLALRTAGLALSLLPLQSFAADPAPIDDATRSVMLYNEGVSALKKNDFKKAAELFEESATIASDPIVRKQSLYNQGNALLKQMDPSQAIEAYQNAYDVKIKNKSLEKDANSRISENLLLASQYLEMMQQQKQGDGEDGEESDAAGQRPEDNKGPRQFKGEDFNDGQKKKIFDLIASEEQQTMQRMMDQRNKNQGAMANSKPW